MRRRRCLHRREHEGRPHAGRSAGWHDSSSACPPLAVCSRHQDCLRSSCSSWPGREASEWCASERRQGGGRRAARGGRKRVASPQLALLLGAAGALRAWGRAGGCSRGRERRTGGAGRGAPWGSGARCSGARRPGARINHCACPIGGLQAHVPAARPGGTQQARPAPRRGALAPASSSWAVPRSHRSHQGLEQPWLVSRAALGGPPAAWLGAALRGPPARPADAPRSPPCPAVTKVLKSSACK